MVTYALDTNIISYILKKDSQVINNLSLAVDNECEFAMLPIVYYEVSRWLLEKNANRLQNEFELMCKEMPLIETNKKVWNKAAELYVRTRQIGKPVGSDADLLIASFCFLMIIPLSPTTQSTLKTLTV